MPNVFQISEDCIGCGLCGQSCITGVFGLQENENGRKVCTIENPQRCIDCFHCTSICPTQAISINGESHTEPLGEPLTVEEARRLMTVRTSIRRFKPDPVTDEQIEQITALTHYAQTAKNSQGVGLVVVRSPEVLEPLRLAMNAAVSTFMGIRNSYPDESGYDLVLRHAPTFIVLTNGEYERSSGDMFKVVDASIQATYIEALAPTFGLGTCWAGFAFAILKKSEEICSMLGLTPDQVGGALMIGKPQLRYKHVKPRHEIPVRYI